MSGVILLDKSNGNGIAGVTATKACCMSRRTPARYPGLINLLARPPFFRYLVLRYDNFILADRVRTAYDRDMSWSTVNHRRASAKLAALTHHTPAVGAVLNHLDDFALTNCCQLG